MEDTVMPLAGRVVAAVIGGMLVPTSVSSVTGTLIVSRSVSSRLTRRVDRMVDGAYRLVVARAAGYRRRDRLRAGFQCFSRRPPVPVIGAGGTAAVPTCGPWPSQRSRAGHTLLSTSQAGGKARFSQ